MRREGRVGERGLDPGDPEEIPEVVMVIRVHDAIYILSDLAVFSRWPELA